MAQSHCKLATTIHIHHRHLLLLGLLSPKADTHILPSHGR